MNKNYLKLPIEKMSLSSLEGKNHLWLVSPNDLNMSDLRWYLESILSQEEKKSYTSFYFSKDKILYLFSHGVLHILLSIYSMSNIKIL
jgi:phosphopantetheinyl transferase